MDKFLAAYLEAALWSSTVEPFGTCPDCGKENKVLCRWNEDQEYVCSECSERGPNYEPPADENYSVDDIAPETLESMKADCAKFQAENDLSENGDSRAGHDFWLTRNGHGAGFWDGDWPNSGDVLTKASKAFGEFNLYVGDDGKLYA